MRKLQKPLLEQTKKGEKMTRFFCARCGIQATEETQLTIDTLSTGGWTKLVCKPCWQQNKEFWGKT